MENLVKCNEFADFLAPTEDLSAKKLERRGGRIEEKRSTFTVFFLTPDRKYHQRRLWYSILRSQRIEDSFELFLKIENESYRSLHAHPTAKSTAVPASKNWEKIVSWLWEQWGRCNKLRYCQQTSSLCESHWTHSSHNWASVRSFNSIQGSMNLAPLSRRRARKQLIVSDTIIPSSPSALKCYVCLLCETTPDSINNDN